MIPNKHWRIRWLCERNELPPFVCGYYAQLVDLPPKSATFDDLRLVVLDTETTGLNPRKDSLLTIGAVAVQHGTIQVADSLELTIKSTKNPDKETIPIHGILPNDIEEGTEEQYALGRFLHYLKADVIVAHHTYFDTTMINRAIRQYAPPFELQNWQLDTAHLAHRIDYSLTTPNIIDHRKYTLDALCDRFDIDMHDRHTASGDAFITAQLLLKLAKILAGRGVHTLGDLLRHPRAMRS